MRTTLTSLLRLKQENEKIAMLTCYDASFAALLEQQGVDILLVGDSLGMVLQGHETTLPVSLDDMVYHASCVARGAKHAFIVSDMPFGSFQISPQATFEHAARLMAAGAQMVKVEGGTAMVETVTFLTQRGIPVCGHLGLTPQSVHQLGGYRAQGKNQASAEQIKQDALLLQKAGASLLVLEAIPAVLAAEITALLTIPTIGIGAGAACSGQVLVLHDMLDIFPGHKPKFVKNFMVENTSVAAAIKQYVHEVKSEIFPTVKHSF